MSSGNKHPSIIAHFVSRYKRNQIYENRFNAKNIKEFLVEGMDKLHNFTCTNKYNYKYI